MATFEDRVKAKAAQLVDALYETLKDLDPAIADAYLVGVNRANKNAPKRPRVGADVVGDGPKRIVSGRGRFMKKDVEAVLNVALRDQQITKEEEEALLIILATATTRGKVVWEPGAREFMIQRIEHSMRHLWSTARIDANLAASFLQPAFTIAFESRGNRHSGTGIHYKTGDFQIIAGEIRKMNIGAWEVSPQRSKRSIDDGKGTAGFYVSTRTKLTLRDALDKDEWVSSNADDIYIVKGLQGKERQTTFVHEATHALQDYENVQSLKKFTEADAFIVESFAALKLGMSFATKGDEPVEVAFREAAPLLLMPTGRRNDKWRSDFRKAYDEVVDAVEDHDEDADRDVDMGLMETERRQKEERDLLRKMRRELQGKSGRRR